MPEYLLLKNTVFDNAIAVAICVIVAGLVILITCWLSVKIFKMIAVYKGYEVDEIEVDPKNLAQYLKDSKFIADDAGKYEE